MSEPLRILQIVTQMNRAGMESRLMDIYRNIDKSKVQFDFYTCRTKCGYFDAEIESYGGKMYYNSPLSICSLFSIPSRFRMFFEAHPEYSIIHCHLNQWCNPVLKGAKLAGVQVRIAHSRTSLEKNNLQNTVKNLVKCGVNRNATHKFAVSARAGEWLFGKSAIKAGEVTIWPNAIDCSRYTFNTEVRSRVRAEMGLGGHVTLIHVGNIRPEKNHAYLLKVFAELKCKEPDAKLIIVGADYTDGAVKKLAGELNLLNDILFLGARSDVPDVLQAGDVFVFPSFYEGFPGAVLEAEAAALPCIISDTITDEVCITKHIERMSIKLPPKQWAGKALEYARGSREDETRLIIDRNYDIHSIVKRYEDFYTGVNTKQGGETYEQYSV